MKMNRPAQNAKFSAGNRLIYGLVGLLLLCLWCFVAFWSWWEHYSIMAANRVELEQLTSAVQEQTKGLFKQAETSLVVCSHWMAEHPEEDPGRAPAFIDLVEQLRKTSGGLLDIRMVTHTGGLRYIPDRGQTHGTQVTDRDYFLAQSDAATRGFYIAKPVLSRVTGKWGIPISVPVQKAGGDVGVLFVAIELDRIASTIELERLKPNGTIGILRLDGTFMFRSPMDGKALGSSIARSPSWTQYLGISPKGVFQSDRSPVDGRARQVSFARVSDYPLVVTVTADLDDLLAGWQVHVAGLALVAALVSAYCLVLGRILVLAMASEDRVRQELEQLMLTDPLTGVGNRRMLTRKLEDEVIRTQRYQRPLTVVFMDLDFFKKINDSYGHKVGDVVLIRVAQSLQASLRPVDHVGRFGGEEFVVLLPETSLDVAYLLVERMRAAIGEIQTTEMLAPVTASAGFAQWRPGETGEALLNRCDKVLYRAKAAGRNCAIADTGAG
jgi:diguanylate cyclase (GGDEF)-like protein